jgi:hypothetical protein
MRRAAVLFAFSLATPLAAAPPAGVSNARLESRSAAAGLDATVKAVLGSHTGPLWAGWVVPTNGKQNSCCWSSGDEAGRGCGGCRLEGKDAEEGVFQGREHRALEGGNRVRVLLRAVGGRVERISSQYFGTGVL